MAERLEDAMIIPSERFKGRVYERMFREAERRLGRQEYLILDATFYKEAYRRRMMELESKGEKVVTILLDCPLEICLKRNRERERPIPERAVKIIWREFERPETPDIYIDTGTSSVEEAVKTILCRLKTSDRLEVDSMKPEYGLTRQHPRAV
ncbi:MAG: AAA family ATPase [Candidatus Bathyarchaeia archaeon]